jgi:hypothetical protein
LAGTNTNLMQTFLNYVRKEFYIIGPMWRSLVYILALYDMVDEIKL